MDHMGRPPVVRTAHEPPLDASGSDGAPLPGETPPENWKTVSEDAEAVEDSPDTDVPSR